MTTTKSFSVSNRTLVQEKEERQEKYKDPRSRARTDREVHESSQEEAFPRVLFISLFSGGVCPLGAQEVKEGGKETVLNAPSDTRGGKSLSTHYWQGKSSSKDCRARLPVRRRHCPRPQDTPGCSPG